MKPVVVGVVVGVVPPGAVVGVVPPGVVVGVVPSGVVVGVVPLVVVGGVVAVTEEVGVVVEVASVQAEIRAIAATTAPPVVAPMPCKNWRLDTFPAWFFFLFPLVMTTSVALPGGNSVRRTL